MKHSEKQLDDLFTYIERKRFNDLADLKQYLENVFENSKIDLSFKSYQDDDYFSNDYEIIIEIKLDDCLIDLDLYYLYDRRNMLYITEFGFEVEK